MDTCNGCNMDTCHECKMDTCHECINIVDKLNEEFDTLQGHNTEIKKINKEYANKIRMLELRYCYRLKCQYCSCVFTRGELEIHQQQCSKKCPYVIKCEYCDHKFERIEFLERHALTCSATPLPSCKFCGEEFLTKGVYFKRHMGKHWRIVMCERCGHKYREHDLKRHRRICRK